MTEWNKLLLAVWAVIFCTSPIQGKTPTNLNEEIVLGMSTALTGPAAELGLNMRAGFLAAFAEANRSDGIQGSKLRLISLDDGYEPARTVPNMHHLINEQKVLAVIGNVGTPTAVSAIPIAIAGKTAFYGAFTGAGVLRKNPPDRYVINFRASYAEETAAMVDALLDEVGLEPLEIAFFTQRDAYGDAGYIGGISALKRHGLRDDLDITHGRYERNTDAVENGLADILEADPPVRAVIMVGAYQPCAKFIKLAKEFQLEAYFLNVSFVGSTPLARTLGQDGDGVIITQVVPHIDTDLPLVKAYRKELYALNSKLDPSFGSLEGYIAGKIFIKALTSINEKPTRLTVIDALIGLGDFKIGIGQKLHLGPNDHQACHKVWPTIIDGGKVVPLKWSQLKK